MRISTSSAAAIWIESLTKFRLLDSQTDTLKLRLSFGTYTRTENRVITSSWSDQYTSNEISKNTLNPLEDLMKPEDDTSWFWASCWDMVVITGEQERKDNQLRRHLAFEASAFPEILGQFSAFPLPLNTTIFSTSIKLQFDKVLFIP